MKPLRKYSWLTITLAVCIAITLSVLLYIVYDSHYWPSDAAFALGEEVGEKSWPDYQYSIGWGPFPDTECVPGSIYVDTDETDDSNCTTVFGNSLCLCVATDTWVALENSYQPPVYGGMVQTADPDSCNPVTIGDQDVFVDVDGYSGGLLSNISFASNTLTVDSGMGGTYHILGSFAFQGINNSVYEFCAAVNGTENVNCCANRELSGQDIGSSSFNCGVSLSAGDDISVTVADHDTTTQDLSICDSQFTIFRLHQ